MVSAAGVGCSEARCPGKWIPAYAGMTRCWTPAWAGMTLPALVRLFDSSHCWHGINEFVKLLDDKVDFLAGALGVKHAALHR